MKLFKRRAKPDEIKSEALTDGDPTHTQSLRDARLGRVPPPDNGSGQDSGDKAGRNVA